MKDVVAMNDDSTDKPTPSIDQHDKNQLGKASLFLNNDTITFTDVPASQLMRNNNDTAAGLGADDRMFNMPINQMCGTVYMKEEDIQTQPTVSEGEVNEREEDMSRGEVSAGAMTTKKCVHMREGRCLIHGMVQGGSSCQGE